MKYFKKMLVAVIFSICSVGLFSACDNPIKANFSETTITIQTGREYDPYDFIEEEINDSVKANIIFKIDNINIAYITPLKMIVATGTSFGTTIISAYYNEQKICWCFLEVVQPTIQLEAPANVHYDSTKGKLVWNSYFTQGVSDKYTATSYLVELTKNNGTPYTVAVNNYVNEISIDKAGTYKARVKTIGSGIYASSDYPKDKYGNYIYYEFNIMANPTELYYDIDTSVLSWNNNGNPEGATTYKVVYTFNGQAEAYKETTDTQIELPTLQAGSHSVYVEVVPPNPEWYSNRSQVLNLTKLATPTMEFNNGILTWNEISGATSYLVKYTLNSTTNTINKSNLTCDLKNIPAGIYSLNLYATSSETNVFNSEPFAYNFEKLKTATVAFNLDEKRFEITNAGNENCKMQLINNATSVVENSTQNNFCAFSKTDLNSYSITAQILAGSDFATKIDGEIATSFIYNNTSLTKIQNLSAPQLTYYEDDGIAYLSFTNATENANYSVFLDSIETDFDYADSTFTLGNVETLFPNAKTYSFAMKTAKDITEKTLFLGATSYVNVVKLVSPTQIGLNSDKISIGVAEGLATQVSTVEYKINNVKTNVLNQQDNSWNISAKYIATTDFETLSNTKTYYTSSSNSNFNLSRLDAPTNFVYDYTNKKFTYDAVEYANSYSFYNEENVEIASNIRTKYYTYQNVGNYTMSIVAVPANNNIRAGESGYYFSNKANCVVAQSAPITNLKLELLENECVKATWTAPENSLEGTVYSVYIDSTLIVSSLNETSYCFDSTVFNEVKPYKILVKVGSLNNNFFTPNNSDNPTVNITRLQAPEKLEKNLTTLTATGFDSNNMTGIYVNEDYIENESTFEMSTEIGETNYDVKFVGKFEPNIDKYCLNSTFSTFKVVKLQNLIKVDLNSMEGSIFNFSWQSADYDDYSANIAFKYYKIVNDVKDNETKYNGLSLSLAYNNTSEFTFCVKEVAKETWSVILPEQTKFIDSDTEKSFNVVKDNAVSNLALDVDKDENLVKISWNYSKLSQLSEDVNYVPKFKIVFNYPNNNITTNYEDLSKFYVGENSYLYEINLNNFNYAGNYRFTISSYSVKTLYSTSESLTLTKLSSVNNVRINGTNGYIVATSSGGELSLDGVEKIAFTGDVAYESLNKTIDLSAITSEEPCTINIQLIANAPSTAVNNCYYLDSEKTTFKFVKLKAVDTSIDFDAKTINWAGNNFATSYNMKIVKVLSSSYQIENLITNSLSFNDSRFSSIINTTGNGTYNIYIKTVRASRIIPTFDASNVNSVGYISSDYSTNPKIVEKLNTPNAPIVKTATNDLKQKSVQILWTNTLNAESYAIYVSDNASSVGNLLANIPAMSGSTTSYTTTTAFNENKTYYVKIQAKQSGSFDSDLSESTKVVRLDKIEQNNMFISSNSVVNITPTTQINSGLFNNNYSYLLEVLDKNGNVKTIIGKDSKTTETIFDLANDLFINNLNGDTFALRITVLGNGTTSSGLTTLASESYTIDVYKLNAPSISIVNNKISISTNDIGIADLLKIMFEVKDGENTLLSNCQYTNEYEISSDWPETITINAYVVIKEVNGNSKNIITSNIATQNHTRLATVQNVKANKTNNNINQSSITISWDAVENAQKYEIYKNSALITTVENATSYITTEDFNLSGNYEIQIKAISTNYASSLLSETISIVRLNPITYGYFTEENDEKVVYITPASQTNVISGYNFTLYQVNENGDVLKTQQTKYDANLTKYIDYTNNSWLTNFDGGTIKILVRTYGTGIFDIETKTTILTSPEYIIDAFKLYTPTMNIYAGSLNIQTASPNFQVQNELEIKDISQNIITVKHKLADESEVFAQTSNGIYMNNYVLNNTFAYPNAWDSGLYSFTYQTLPKENIYNVLSSNIATKTTTRLDAPTNLTFTRNVLENTSNYHSDVELQNYLNSDITFSFDPVQNANSYYLKNSYSSYTHNDTSNTSIFVVDDFEKFLNSGSASKKTLQIQATSQGGNYINSKMSSINYQTLSQISTFISNNGVLNWATQNYANSYLIKASNSNSGLEYWQSLNGTTNSSILNGILDNFESGQILLNIKALGNITTEGLTSEDTIIIDSQYLTENQPFTKLIAPSSLSSHLGFIKFDKINLATYYTASVYQEDELVLTTDLTNIYNKLFDNNQNIFIGVSDELFTLTPETLYNIKVQAKSNEKNIIYSDISLPINIKILNNSNLVARDIALEFAGSGDLTQTKIATYVSPNAYGLISIYNNKYNVVNKVDNAYNQKTKILLTPDVSISGETTYSYASLGSSSLENDGTNDFYYLSSSFTTSNPIYILQKPEISINDGKVCWTQIDNAIGYYVYINGNLYNNELYRATSLSLPTDFGNIVNTEIDVEIIAVSNESSTLYSALATYTYNYLINSLPNFENISITKLKIPQNFTLSDGAMLYENAFGGLDFFDATTYNYLLTTLKTNKTVENVNNILDYLELMFNNTIVNFSKYTGFDIGTVVLEFKNLGTNEKYYADIEANYFFKLSELQKTNLIAIVNSTQTELASITFPSIPFDSNKAKYFGNIKDFTSSEYIAYSVYHLQNMFKSNNVSSLLSLTTATNEGFPDIKDLFEELNASTKAIPAGNYELTITQKGNNYNYLDSSISNTQKIIIPTAPTNTSIIDLNGDYVLTFDNVELALPLDYTYTAKLTENTTSNDIVYVLFGEGNDGNRFEITRSVGIPTGTTGNLYINLTELVNNGKLTPDITKIFLVVAGDNNIVVNGLKSKEYAITVLPTITPTMNDGIIKWNSLVSAYNYEIKALADGMPEVCTLQTSTSWIGDELSTGTSYNLTIRALGNIYENLNGEKSFVISGRTFNCLITKLDAMEVVIDNYGVFNWSLINNSKGFIVNIPNLEKNYVFKDSGNVNTYEATDFGFNSFEFRALGDTCIMQSGANNYYLSSHINNSQTGTKATMLSAVNSVFVEDGLIKWNPIVIDENSIVHQAGMNKVIGYRLTIDNGFGKLYSTLLTAKEYFTDTAGNLAFDFTEYGYASSYNLTIQPYVYFANNDFNVFKNATVNNNSTTYYYLLGVAKYLQFEKISAPTDLQFLNGEIVWTGHDDDNYYVEISTVNGILNTYIVEQNTWWSDDENITTIQDYTARVKAYQNDNNSVFSVYAKLSDINGVLKPFRKLAIPSLDIKTYSANESNFISFDYPQSNVGFNIKYRVNSETEFQYLLVSDTNYENIITFINDEVIININEIRSDIKTMDYFVQIVPLGSDAVLKSNYSTKFTYSTPKAIDNIYLDSENQTYYWKYQGNSLGYIIQDELYSEDTLIATYYYKIGAEDLSTSNCYSIRTIDSVATPCINFMPIVVGYTHKISVAVSLNPFATTSLMSTYTTCEDTLNFELFECETNLFATNSSLFSIESVEDARNYITQHSYGTATNPYKINSATDFANINKRLVRFAYTSSYIVEYERISGDDTTAMSVSVNENTTSLYFKLTQDLTGITTMIGTRIDTNGVVDYYGFANTFDGNNHTITYNISAEFTSQKLGLFNQIEKLGIVKNLKLNANLDFAQIEKSSQIVGFVSGENYGTIQNVEILTAYITGLVNDALAGLDSLTFGGITGVNYNLIEKAITNAEINLSLYLSNSGTYIYAGGIAGKNNKDATIQYSGNNMSLSVEAKTSAFVGGVIGSNNGTVLQCYNKGTISAKTISAYTTTNLGGIVGDNTISGVIESCYTNGNIIATNSENYYINAGGIVGLSKNCAINNCYSSIQTIIIRTTSSGTIYGGTLFGTLENPNTTNNKNYFYNNYAISNKTNLGIFATNVSGLSQTNFVASLNAGYQNQVYIAGTTTPKLLWEI